MQESTDGGRHARQIKPLASAAAPASPRKKRAQLVPWRERIFLPLPVAGEVTGLSVGSLYRLEGEGRVRFHRLGGRTLIRTADVLAMIDSAQPWVASTTAAAAARARRAELARAKGQGAADAA